MTKLEQQLNNLCRYCEKKVSAEDLDYCYSYWLGNKYICHKNCKIEGQKLEAFDCQIIDSDCNDCHFFKRKEIVGKEVWSGECLKFNKETRAFPKKWTGRECFEHRRNFINK